jgi:Fic family protein
MFDSNQAFDALPRLPPARDLETRKVLKHCIAARAALAELNVASQLIPNPAMLVNTLPLLEAQDSSSIENIITTTDELFKYVQVDDAKATPATKEAAHYCTALFEGFHSLAQQPLCTRTALDICSTLKNRPMDIRKLPGTTLRNSNTQEAIYTPPVGQTLLRDLLINWEFFIHEKSPLDPLVRLAVLHYQFEAIHPFLDGNGRTGRIINVLYLVHAKLLTLPILYLSHFILAHRQEYCTLLLGVSRDQAWEPWIVFMLAAIENTARWTTEKIASIKRLQVHTIETMRRVTPKIYSRELADIIFTQPCCRIVHLIEAGIAKRQTAASYLNVLCGAGILTESKVGKDRLFIHPKLMRLLTEEDNSFAPYPLSRDTTFSATSNGP